MASISLIRLTGLYKIIVSNQIYANKFHAEKLYFIREGNANLAVSISSSINPYASFNKSVSFFKIVFLRHRFQFKIGRCLYVTL